MERQTTEVTINRTKLSIAQGDITKQATEVIVNAANPSLMGGVAWMVPSIKQEVQPS